MASDVYLSIHLLILCGAHTVADHVTAIRRGNCLEPSVLTTLFQTPSDALDLDEPIA